MKPGRKYGKNKEKPEEHTKIFHYYLYLLNLYHFYNLISNGYLLTLISGKIQDIQGGILPLDNP
jgi:hypothetical protein